MAGVDDLDSFWMKRALALAAAAARVGEVPIAAIVTKADRLVAVGVNTRERLGRVCGHAETVALERAARRTGSCRLTGCTVYVTLEPCVMCAGALQQARVGRLFYGASDPKGGAAGSLFDVLSDSRLNHQVPVVSGLFADESAALLKSFFKARR